jgi:hypothetical protein
MLYNYINMSEQIVPQQLTPEQLEVAQDLIDWCGLNDVANEELIMMGQSGTVIYGLGRCAHHFANSTPEEIREMVIAKLKEQNLNTSTDSTT